MSPESNLIDAERVSVVVMPKLKKKRLERLAPAKHDELAKHDEPIQPKSPWSQGIAWWTVAWIAAAHIGAVIAPFYFSWQGFVTFLVLIPFTAMIGVTLGYHRLLTHGSFVTYRPVRWFLALVGGLSGEGSALSWIANHRKHHVHSDQEGDPHSPNEGAWWSHMFWFMPAQTDKEFADLTERWAPDLVRDPVMVALHKLFFPLHVLFGLALYAIGRYGWNAEVGTSMVMWGMFARLAYVYHITWFVNSATHMWGYRNYETTDNSRNLWWVGILAFGEGWHNNHHAYQRMAKHGHKWWEIDQTWWVIVGMEKLGLAWKVVKDVPHRERPA